MEDESHGVPVSSIAINMWKQVLEVKNLTNQNKTPEEITDAAKEFRELFIENSYLSQEVVKEIKIVDSTNTHIPLEKRISMFPEAGEFFIAKPRLCSFTLFSCQEIVQHTKFLG